MHITLFESVGKAYVFDHLDSTWDDVVDLLLEHRDRDAKIQVPLFNMAEFKTLDDPSVELGRRYHGTVVDGDFVRDVRGTYDEIPNTVRRCKGNVVNITGIVLDVDEQMTIEQAITMLDGLEYVLYTTFRHTVEKHKFRIVIPFTRPLLAEDIAGRQASITETFPGVDSASFTVSQSFYFHSGKQDSIAYHNQGIMLDPYDNFEYREPAVYTEQARSSGDNSMSAEQAGLYKQAVVKSLMSCSGLHYAGTGTSNAVLTLISICRSVGCSFEEYDAICQKIAHPDSQLVNNAVRVAAWTGWDGDRIRKDKRDAFIESYGGEPVVTARNSNARLDTARHQISLMEQAIINKYKKETNEQRD